MDLGVATYALWGVRQKSSDSFYIDADNKIMNRSFSNSDIGLDGLEIPRVPKKLQLMEIETLMVMGHIAKAAKYAKQFSGRSSYKKDAASMAYLEAIMAAEDVIIEKSLANLTEIAEEGEMGLHHEALSSFKQAFGSSKRVGDLRDIKATLTGHENYTTNKKAYTLYNKVLAAYLKKAKYQSIDKMQAVVDAYPDGYHPGLFEYALTVIKPKDFQ